MRKSWNKDRNEPGANTPFFANSLKRRRKKNKTAKKARKKNR